MSRTTPKCWVRYMTGAAACPECSQSMKFGGFVLVKREDNGRQTCRALGGPVLDGGPKLLGFSSGAAMVLSTLALGLVVLGAVLLVRGGAFAKARRVSGGD
ncbi:hypothetical protein ACFWAN_30510 [Streptomyces mirabilis]|uniref:hypothetical protein n=1 Tax=Streptomyces mirabilis TaxID=68239 RepID=UPI003649F8AC